MGDLFDLFDGALLAGGAPSVDGQHASSFSGVEEENELASILASGSNSIQLRVDYSDFANFITFNSAYSYVNVTADKILNEYPYGGSVDLLQLFLNSLDGYQRYVLTSWPSRSGHLRPNPANGLQYVAFDDFGVQDGIARSSFMSPGTGSFSVCAWVDVPVLTGSNDVMVLFQKRKSTGDGYSLFASGSALHFQIVSGALSQTVSTTVTARPLFVAATCDRSSTTSSLSIYTATTGTYPSLGQTASVGIGARFDLASSSFYIGSGTISSKVTRPFSGSMDDVSVWSKARTLADMSSSFNRKVFAQSGLLGAWRFNEASDAMPAAGASLVLDCSGHRLDGRIRSYSSSIRGSGSLAYDAPDPILSLDEPAVLNYLLAAQLSGTAYDRNNGSMVFNMFPEAFAAGGGEGETSAEVFSNFALILARHFDRIKLYIDQFVNLYRVKYGEFDQAPDDLLVEVGRFFGWELGATFADADALRYFISRNILGGTAGNAGLDLKLHEVKSQFWRRFLQNLMYVYKTKGTRESVEAVLRTHGVNNGFVRLKEYARKSYVKLPVTRVVTQKSVYALKFGADGNASNIVAHFTASGGGGGGPEWTVDGDIGIPQDSTEWTAVMSAAGLAGGNPSLLWNMQDPTGSVVVDRIGTINGAGAGTLAYATDVASWDSNSIQPTSGIAGTISSTNAGLPNIATNSFMLLLYLKTPTFCAQRTVVQMGTVFGADFAAETNASEQIVLSRAGVTTAGATAFCDGTVQVLVMQIDRTNNACRLYTKDEVVQTTAGGSGKNLLLGGDNIQTYLPEAIGYMYTAGFFNSAAEMSRAEVKTLLETLGWAPIWSP